MLLTDYYFRDFRNQRWSCKLTDASAKIKHETISKESLCFGTQIPENSQEVSWFHNFIMACARLLPVEWTSRIHRFIFYVKEKVVRSIYEQKLFTLTALGIVILVKH